MLINREINSLTKIENKIIKNRFNLKHSLNGSIIKIMSRKTGLLFKKYEFTLYVAILWGISAIYIWPLILV